MLEFSSTNNDCNCDNNSLEGFQKSTCNTPEVINWNSIQGKPSCFVPCAHTHTPNQIIGLDTYIQGIQFATGANSTNSIQANLLSGILSFSLKLSANSGTGYKVPLSILSDGLIGQIPFASGTNSGILTSSDWINFNNKFNTPTGTISQYIRGDGSLGTFPSSTFGPAGGDLAGTYPNPTVLWSNGYTNYDTRYYRVTNPSNYISFASIISGFSPVNSTINNGDTIVQAFSKTQGQINSKWTRPVFTTGSVLFWSGSDVAQNNGEFFWNNINNRLGIGTLTPSAKLHIFGPASSGLTALIENYHPSQKIGYRVGTLGGAFLFGQFSASEFGFGSENNANFFIFTDNTKLLVFRNSTSGGTNDPHIRFDRTNFTFSDFGLGGTTNVTGFVQRNNEGIEFIGAQIYSSVFTIGTGTSGTVALPRNIATVDITNGRANGSNLLLDLSGITREGTTIVIRMGGVSGGNNYSVTLTGATTSPINSYSLSTNSSLGRTISIRLINGVWQLISIF
jgi:hypothetical protein